METKTEKIAQICYDILLISFLAYRVFFNTMFRKDFGIKRCEMGELIWLIAAALLLAVKIFLMRCYSRGELVILGLLIVLCFTARWKSDTYWIAFLPFVAGGAKKVPFERILKIFLITVGGMLLVTAIAAQSGFITNLVYLQPEPDGSIRVRSSFGTTYPTTFSEFIFFLSAAFFYLRRRKLKFYDPLLLAAVSAFLLYFCDARTDVLCVGLLAAAAVWSMIRKMLPDKVKETFWKLSSLLTVTMPLLAGAVIIGAWRYYPDSRILSKVDALLNTRLSLGKKGFRKYGVSFFGTYVKYKTSGGKLETVKNYFNLDSSYLLILINFGILLFVLLLALFTWSSWRSWREKEFVLLAILTVIALECFMENRLIQAQFNIFLLIFFAHMTNEDGRSYSMLTRPAAGDDPGGDRPGAGEEDTARSLQGEGKPEGDDTAADTTSELLKEAAAHSDTILPSWN